LIILVIIFFAALTILIGKYAFGSWFNHLGIYGAVWGFTLAVFHSGLYRYYPLESETWMLIIAAWLAFLFGSLTMIACRAAVPPRENTFSFYQPGELFFIEKKELHLLHRTLWVLNIILILHTTYEVYNVVRILGGGLANVVILANKLYGIRVQEGIPGSIPYFGSLAFLAAILSGIYTSAVGKLKLVAFIPFIISIAISFVQVVRAFAVIVAVLFISAYFLNRKRTDENIQRTFKNYFRRVVAIGILISLLVVTLEVIRTTRGVYEKFSGETSTLRHMRTSGSSFISPSVIMYISVHSGVLNQYLKEDQEHVVWGRYTLAPMWRLVSKFGFETFVGFYQSWFYQTPAPANTGTYIRELHADFGVSGVVIVPYLLGLVASLYWFRIRERNKLLDIIILAHIYAVVGMSWFVMLTQLGGWFLSLATGIIIARIVDRKLNIQ